MRRVLVVDDYADAREMLRVILEDAGYSVDEAENGREAVDRALAEPPSAILMDIAMPVLDGREATRILKGDPRTAHVPVLAVTGQAAHDAVCPPCDMVFYKPIDVARLLAALDARIDADARRARGSS